MKAKVNPKSGMVALVAGKSVMNVAPGKVFGVRPKDAAKLLQKKQATLATKLPDDSNKWDEVDINIEQGVVGDAKQGEAEKPPAK